MAEISINANHRHEGSRFKTGGDALCPFNITYQVCPEGHEECQKDLWQGANCILAGSSESFDTDYDQQTGEIKVNAGHGHGYQHYAVATEQYSKKLNQTSCGSGHSGCVKASLSSHYIVETLELDDVEASVEQQTGEIALNWDHNHDFSDLDENGGIDIYVLSTWPTDECPLEHTLCQVKNTKSFLGATPISKNTYGARV